mmetsp:Transcript_27234/g.40213  ORF Transcript_27234/g.40213 Transcript_27234/m.40213 type:complete len:298 (+) Transcript_27234:19-912(+)
MGNKPAKKVIPGQEIMTRSGFDVALSKLENTLTEQSRIDPNSVDSAKTLDKIGEIYWRKGKLDDALNCFKSSLFIKEREVPDSLSYAITLSNIGCVFKEIGDFEQALNFLNKSLSIKKKHVSKFSMDTARSYSNLANVLNSLGRKTEAKELYEQSLAIKKRLEPDSASTVISYVNVATSCHPKEAMKILSKAHSIVQKSQKRNDSLMVYILTNMAIFQFKLGDTKGSLITAQHALAMEKTCVGPDSLTAAGIYDIMAKIYEKIGQPTAANDVRSRSTRIRRSSIKPAHPSYRKLRGT